MPGCEGRPRAGAGGRCARGLGWARLLLGLWGRFLCCRWFSGRHARLLSPRLPASRQDFLPADIQTQFAVSRELIRNIYNSFYKLRDRAERMVSRAIDNAADLLVFGKELRQVTLLGSDRQFPGEGSSGFGGGLGAGMTLIPACSTPGKGGGRRGREVEVAFRRKRVRAVGRAAWSVKAGRSPRVRIGPGKRAA